MATTTDGIAGVATKGRFFAMWVDSLVASFLGLLAASRLPPEADTMAVPAVIVVYLSYFLLQEGIWSTTFGKRLFRLTVCGLDGSRCGWRAATVRTLARVLEVNPILLGALPGAIAVAVSRRRQRIGDMLAGTVVLRATPESTE